MKKEREAYEYLGEYRGKDFAGEWPTLVEMLRITVKRHPKRPCFTIYEPDRMSLNYEEAIARIEAVGRWLYSKGVRKGDKVALTGKNAPEWTVAYLGILFAGAVIVPIDAQLHFDECVNLIKVAGAKILFADEEKHDKFVAERGRIGVIEEIVSLHKGLGAYLYDIDGTAADIELPTEHDLAAILFTSGTTGKPKGVMLSHRNLVSDNYLAQCCIDLSEHDVFYALLPIHHAYSMTVFLVVMALGAELVFGKRMVTQQILKDLKQAQVTIFLGVPMLFNKLLAGILRGIKQKGPIVYAVISFLMGVSGLIKKVTGMNPGKKLFHAVLEKASLTSVRICICGGGPLAASVTRAYNQMGVNFIQGYGLTETSPIINLNPVEHYKEASVGRVVRQVEEKVLNPDERGVGEIAVRGPVVMQGYYNMPEETAAIMTEDGWLKTGDLGYLDSENYLYLTGRAKNVIVTAGGKNVYPEEIENEFQLFEEIDQILVRGYVFDKKTKDERIEALVYPSQDYWKDADKAAIQKRIEEIVAEVNQRLLSYGRIEKTTLIAERMEETTTKKIKRDSLKY
ncbi:MAG: AMP-binding protein [Spirochaetaceae bacterium]|jgi:long-chain acyl-CoA synthetase|nr:AMP-binding protein [Spirochaetaceae bacterium]